MPDTIVVDGIPYDVYTDFRTWMKAGYLLEEFSVATDEDQTKIFLELYDLVVKENPKGDILADDFLDSVAQFYSGYPKVDNDASKKRKERDKEHPKPPSFDFVYDSAYIYCSFASFYHIRLWEIEYMHWWEFLTLFEGLMMSDTTSVNFVVGARQAKTTGKMPKEERNRVQKLQKDFALPKSEKQQKQEDNLKNALVNLSRKSRDKRKGQEGKNETGDDLSANEGH